MPAPHFQPVWFSDNAIGAPVTYFAIPTTTFTTGNPTGLNPDTTFSTSEVVFGALDLTFGGFVGGTSPGITFVFSRQGADGLWYTVWNSGSVTTATTFSIDTAPSAATATTGNPNAPIEIINAVYTNQARLTWTISGSPTSYTLSGSFIGR